MELDILMVAWMIGLFSTALLFGGLSRRASGGRHVRVTLVIMSLLGFAWAALVLFQIPSRVALPLAEVVGTYLHDGKNVTDRLELRPDCSFTRTYSRGAVVVLRQVGRWGPSFSDPSTACVPEGQRLTRLLFVDFDRACGAGFEPYEHEPGLIVSWPFCDDQGTSIEFAEVCTVAGRIGIRSGDYIWARE